jgi:ElaB/YqjD/DUF883 family membrane-anchored ribosome-binding protein
MEISDRLKRLTDKAKDGAAEHKEELEKSLDKAEQLVDQRTGGRYHDQLEKTKTKADAYVEGLEQKDPDRAKGS